jgi:ribosome-binding factor A
MAHREYTRNIRVAAELRREVALLVHELVRAGELPSVSVSDVEVTRDIAHANVFVTALDPKTAAQAVKDLNEGARELRRELSRTMKLRSVPQLHFKYDDSVDRGERIDALLRETPPAPERGSDD